MNEVNEPMFRGETYKNDNDKKVFLKYLFLLEQNIENILQAGEKLFANDPQIKSLTEILQKALLETNKVKKEIEIAEKPIQRVNFFQAIDDNVEEETQGYMVVGLREDISKATLENKKLKINQSVSEMYKKSPNYFSSRNKFFVKEDDAKTFILRQGGEKAIHFYLLELNVGDEENVSEFLGENKLDIAIKKIISLSEVAETKYKLKEFDISNH